MKAKNVAVAQKLLNLYRQEHVIIGGWSAVNPVFINEATDDVIKELREMPTGKLLIRHIENLRSGKTPMDSIATDLLPYGGLMEESAISNIILTHDEIKELESALSVFTTDQQGLDKINNLGLIHKFGEEWQSAIRAGLSSHPQLQAKWDTVVHTYRAYQLWDTASQIITQPLNERTRAEIQAEIPEYETYLPMFGDAGSELLTRLRTFISTSSQPED